MSEDGKTSGDKPTADETQTAEDLEVADEGADQVRGGDGVPVSNILKGQHDVQSQIVGNVKA